MNDTNADLPIVHRVGGSSIQKIWETDLNGMTFGQLLPDLDVGAHATDPEWFPGGTFDDDGHAFMSLHAWLVRHEGLVILVDTGAGNAKSRPQQKILDGLSNPFLERLRAAGVGPDEVDYVLHTHIHSDHVGWDTSRSDGGWTPTFPNARIVVSDLEYAYGEALTDGDEPAIAAARARAGLGEPVRTPVPGTFVDSILPAARAGLVRRIQVDGREVLPGIRFLPTPGHSIDHASIELVSEGRTALFSGDVVHHPIEIPAIDVVSTFCEFPDATRRSRRWLLDRAVESEATVFTSHFPLSSTGRVERTGDGFRWVFA